MRSHFHSTAPLYLIVHFSYILFCSHFCVLFMRHILVSSTDAIGEKAKQRKDGKCSLSYELKHDTMCTNVHNIVLNRKTMKREKKTASN